MYPQLWKICDLVYLGPVYRAADKQQFGAEAGAASAEATRAGERGRGNSGGNGTGRDNISSSSTRTYAAEVEQICRDLEQTAQQMQGRNRRMAEADTQLKQMKGRAVRGHNH